MIRAVSVGDNCIDTYRPPFNKKYVGGNAVNVAIHMHKAGCSAAYLGAVGQDADGLVTIDRLREQGVATDHVQILPGNTAYTIVELTPEGERQFIHEDMGPARHFALSEADLVYIGQHDLVHNTWLGGTEDYLPAYRRFPGLLVSMDYGERYTQDFFDRTIANVDLAFFSMEPGHMRAAHELATGAARRGPKVVVVTLGYDGSLAFSDGRVYFQPAIPVKVVDTLGAGDTYIAYFLVSRLMGKSVPAGMDLAAKAAAQTCKYFGAWENSEIV